MPKAATEPSLNTGRRTSDSQVELIWHHNVENILLTGCAWDEEGTLLSTGYDTDVIDTYRYVPARKM